MVHGGFLLPTYGHSDHMIGEFVHITLDEILQRGLKTISLTVVLTKSSKASLRILLFPHSHSLPLDSLLFTPHTVAPIGIAYPAHKFVRSPFGSSSVRNSSMTRSSSAPIRAVVPHRQNSCLSIAQSESHCSSRV